MRNDIPFKQVDLNTNFNDKLELLAITIPTELGQILVINVYRNPRTPAHDIDLSYFFDSLSTFSYILIWGDFNSHHQSWGCDHVCPSGIALSDAISNSNLNILKNGKPTLTPRPGQSNTTINFTLVSFNLKPLSSWSTLVDGMGSDHSPISINIGIPFIFY